MLFKGVKKYIINPSVGLLSSILYFIIFGITRDVPFSLIMAILFSLVGDVAIRLYSKTIICSVIFLINTVSFTLTLIIWYFLRDAGARNMIYIIFYEMTLFTSIVITRMLKPYIIMYIGRKKSGPVENTFLNEYFEIAQIIQYFVTFRLFVIIIYRFVYEDTSTWKNWDTIFYFITPCILASSIIIYEIVKTRNIAKRLELEEWLPIVNESGEVTGRIARSVSSKMKNKFMHPVVRVALVHKGKLYLQKRPSDDSPAPDTYDHPFEKYMLFNHEINVAVKNSISKHLGVQELPFSFLLKYVYENEDTKRLVLLFVSRIENEEQLESTKALRGKFWTMKQIEDSFGDDGVFSECFQLEYEYLKNTILHSELLKKEHSSTASSN